MRPFNLIVAGLLVVGWTGCKGHAPVPPATLKAVFFDVGQGDAALISLPSGPRLLVDAGPRGCGIDTLLLNRHVSTLDGVVLTHPHEDHYGGFREVLAAATVGRLYLPEGTVGGTGWETLLHFIIDTAGIDTALLPAGRTLYKSGEAAVVCLWPPADPVSCEEDSVNARSLVLEVIFGRSRLFLTGDLPFCGERTLIEWQWLKPATVLKIGHHGSRTSTSASMLALLSPVAAIVSAGGGNGYGHPSSETLDRIETSGARLYRTDRSGTVTFWMDDAGGLVSDRAETQGR